MKFLFVGDIFTEEDHNIVVHREKYDYFFANLEAPLYCKTVYPSPRVKGIKICSKSDPKFIKKFNNEKELS